MFFNFLESQAVAEDELIDMLDELELDDMHVDEAERIASQLQKDGHALDDIHIDEHDPEVNEVPSFVESVEVEELTESIELIINAQAALDQEDASCINLEECDIEGMLEALDAYEDEETENEALIEFVDEEMDEKTTESIGKVKLKQGKKFTKEEIDLENPLYSKSAGIEGEDDYHLDPKKKASYPTKQLSESAGYDEDDFDDDEDEEDYYEYDTDEDGDTDVTDFEESLNAYLEAKDAEAPDDKDMEVIDEDDDLEDENGDI